MTAEQTGAVFTLSLGIAAIEIFGSYMTKDHTLGGEAVRICALDTFVAMISGLIIFPACFAFGVQPDVLDTEDFLVSNLLLLIGSLVYLLFLDRRKTNMIIKNGLVFSKEGYFENRNLYLKGDMLAEQAEGEVLDASGFYVIPGLIDIHFHGCAGYDFCDATKEAMEAITAYQQQNGITAICPASMTFPEEKLIEIFKNAASYKGKDGAELVGINMEGPFVSMEKRGAQNGAYIQKPNAEMFERLQKAANGLIKLVAIAPEEEGAMECIRQICGKVRVSLAHTSADFDTADLAFKSGAKQVTHLYNAMQPYTHRAPGVIGAACDNEEVMVELICDGVHNHPAAVRTTFKMFGDDRIIFISDSMRACGLGDGQYTLGGKNVTVRGKIAVLSGTETIAGSVTDLMNCLRTAVKEMRIPLESAVKCATVNPAKAIGIFEQYGSLESGKKADILLLDKELEIHSIIKSGKIVYQRD